MLLPIVAQYRGQWSGRVSERVGSWYSLAPCGVCRELDSPGSMVTDPGLFYVNGGSGLYGDRPWSAVLNFVFLVGRTAPGQW